MRREEHVDYHLVADHHLGIHARLEAWARWVRVRPHGWQMQPMFKQYRSKRQWDEPFSANRSPINLVEAVEMEKAVSALPAKHRDAIRWAYVWQLSPIAEARRLGVSKQGLLELIQAGRAMLINRSKR